MNTKNLFLLVLCAATTTLAATPLSLVSPQKDATVSTLSDGQKAYLKMPRAERIAFFADGKKRLAMKSLGYYPQPVTLAWNGGAAGATYTVTVKRLPDGKVFYTHTGPETSIKVDNLEIARTYEWTVTGGGELKSTFSTEDIAPRLIRIPGIPNVRDLGGRIGLDGRRVRQGRVFRTAGLNDNAHDVFYTKEELAAQGRLAELDAQKKSLKEQEKMWKAYADNPSSVKVLDCPLKHDWTMQLADGQIEPVKTHHGSFNVKTVSKDPVTFTQSFDAPDNGVFLMNPTMSQYSTIRVNGEIVHDFLGVVAKRHQLTQDDATIAVPVRKGRNEIVATVATAGRTRAWRFSKSPKAPLAKALASMMKNVKMRRECLGKIAKGRAPGRNRLTDETRAYMLNELGIKSDIDLRSDGECYGMTGSPLGPSVTWFHYSSSAYGGMQTDGGKAAFKKVFAVFLDERNYPIDFHCIAGQDRTGAVAFILNGLLGVAEEDLYLDWETTGFWNGSSSFCHERLFNHLVSGFQKLPGDTLHAKIENYVLALDFTKDDIAKFRALMLE